MTYKFDGVAIAKRQGPNIAANEYGCRIWLSRAIPQVVPQPLVFENLIPYITGMTSFLFGFNAPAF
jgi:hypothetical protein